MTLSYELTYHHFINLSTGLLLLHKLFGLVLNKLFCYHLRNHYVIYLLLKFSPPYKWFCYYLTNYSTPLLITWNIDLLLPHEPFCYYSILRNSPMILINWFIISKSWSSSTFSSFIKISFEPLLLKVRDSGQCGQRTYHEYN